MKKVFQISIILILLSGLFTSQFFADKSKSRSRYIEPHLFKPEVIKAADLGLDNAAGDLFWLLGIQYYGGGESRYNEKMADYLNLASDLNPRFSYPYAFGALILPGLNQTDQAIALADKGIKNSDPDWRIAYYIATTFYFNKNDQANALKYFDIAAHTPGAPDNIQKIAANFATKGDKRQKSKEIWTGIYETTRDDTVRERAKIYVYHYELMDFLEQAISQYKSRYGSYPADLNDLVTGKILTSIPADPFGIEYKINQNNGTLALK